MEKRIIKNWLNYNDFPREFEKFTEPSQTVPDQAMSVTEILRRFARGLPLGGQRVPIYEGEEDVTPDLRTLDLAEIQELKENNLYQIQTLKSQLNEKAQVQTNGNTGNGTNPPSSPQTSGSAGDQ